ncbi:hypothetical protein EUA02_29900 [Mycobacterium paragordonae]|nr:hypothetical protein EUA02_29900 [Mycobacterium paragordonae]TDK98953.1 hypothetical protein EUA05_31085 [Mycobacterium paragordonae]
MQKTCVVCKRSYQAKRKESLTCSATCRSRKRHMRHPSEQSEVSDNPLVVATKRELEAAGKLDSMLGQQALALAARMSGADTVAGYASLSRELRTVMAAAIGVAPAAPPAAGQGDEVDELRARRDAKRAG